VRIAFIALVVVHALIHLLGFVKAYELKEVRELALPISKSMGIIWLVAALLLLTYGFLELSNARYAWLCGFAAVLLSQVLVFIFWKDARFGTLPNVLILVMSLMAFGTYRFQNMVKEETSRILAQGTSGERLVLVDDLRTMPRPIQKWLRHSGMIGKPFLGMGRITQRAEMKMKPNQENWMSATATQFTNIDKPSFLWTTRVKMNGLLYFLGRDKFENGMGSMLIKMNSLFNVVNAEGEKIDEGSLQRYLGEMVWFPSMALSPYITWEAIDSNTAKATMEYNGTRGSGTFFFNEDGDFVQYSAQRFKGNEEDAIRYEWVLSVQEYREFHGIRIPSLMTATWKLPEGDWTWLKLEITDMKFDEPVGEYLSDI
jgi:hypothetical protein